MDEGFERLLSIDDDAVIAANVSVLLHDSSLNNMFGLPVKFGKVSIGKNSYIGAGTTILAGVSIGENTLIGARSLVTRSIPSGKLAFGSPAEVICGIDDHVNRYIKSLNNPGGHFYWDITRWRDRINQMTGEEEAWKFNELIFLNRELVYPDAKAEVSASDRDVNRYMAYGWRETDNTPPAVRLMDKTSLAYLKKNAGAKALKIKYHNDLCPSVTIRIDRIDPGIYQLKTDIWDIIEIPLKDSPGEQVIEVMIEPVYAVGHMADRGNGIRKRIAVERMWVE